MKKDNRNLIYVWFFAALIPIVQSIIIVKNKNLDGFCSNIAHSKPAKGVFCTWGPDLGHAIFGAQNSYLGMVILLITISIGMVGFGLFMMRK